MNHLFTPIVESMTSSQTAVSRNLSTDLSGGLEYHELGVRHPVETNVLEELKHNLDQLEDLHFRLKYLMGEIGQHTRKRS
jgi:hypothetical protein